MSPRADEARSPDAASTPGTTTAQTQVSPRSRVLLALITVIGLAAFFWPFGISATSAASEGHANDAPFIFALLIPLLLATLVSEVSSGSLDAKAVAYMGVLAAAGAALRLAGAGVSGFEATFFLLIPAGRVFGRSFGFVLGCVTILVSGLLTGGVGPWMPFQMLGAAWIGFGAGCLPPAKARAEVWMLAAYGVLVGLAYGVLLNLWFWPWVTGLDTGLTYVESDTLASNLEHYLAFYAATSLGWDIPRAITNAVLMVLAGGPLLRALRRSSRRGSFGVSGEFGPVRSAASGPEPA